jgi:hypothetical protein
VALRLLAPSRRAVGISFQAKCPLEGSFQTSVKGEVSLNAALSPLLSFENTLIYYKESIQK